MSVIDHDNIVLITLYKESSASGVTSRREICRPLLFTRLWMIREEIQDVFMASECRY